MPQIVAQLAITLDDVGNINVNGPIDNQLLVYGMLEMAKQAIHIHGEKNKRLIQEVAPGTVLKPV